LGVGNAFCICYRAQQQRSYPHMGAYGS
ncbi:hypothetical protein D043_2221B, partial [Vibrio parahaemolyticus EKP-021]